MATPTGRPDGARRWFAGACLTLYALFVMVTLFWPTPVDRDYHSLIQRALEIMHTRGLPDWFDYRQLEFTANIGMFVPLGFLIALLLTRRSWWIAVAASAGFSILSELGQAAFLPQRVASVADVIANSTGALVGALLALGLRTLLFPKP